MRDVLNIVDGTLAHFSWHFLPFSYRATVCGENKKIRSMNEESQSTECLVVKSRVLLPSLPMAARRQAEREVCRQIAVPEDGQKEAMDAAVLQITPSHSVHQRKKAPLRILTLT